MNTYSYLITLHSVNNIFWDVTTHTQVTRCLPLQGNGKHYSLHCKSEDMMLELLSVFIIDNCYLIEILPLSKSNKKYFNKEHL